MFSDRQKQIVRVCQHRGVSSRRLKNVKASVLSNIGHYHHLAAALEHCGILDQYLCNWVPINDDPLPRWIPDGRRCKLEGRRLKNIPTGKVTRFAFPEMIQRFLPLLGFSHDRADQVNNALLDYSARTCLSVDLDVFHFVSGIGFYSASLARQRGARIVCDVRQEHPEFQRRILEEESARFHVPARVIGQAYEQKVLAEFDLADFLVVPSSHCRRTFLDKGFSAERVIVNSYGVDAVRYRLRAPPGRRFPESLMWQNAQSAERYCLFARSFIETAWPDQ